MESHIRNSSMNRNKITAFSLLEVVLAITLVTLMSLGIISMLLYSQSYAKLERERSGAIAAATKKMEQIKRKFFKDLAPSTETVLVDDNQTPTRPADDVQGTMDVTFKAKDGTIINGPPPDNNIIQVQIVVSWHPAGRLSNKLLKERVYTYLTP